MVVQVRWIPTAHNPADAFTREMEGDPIKFEFARKLLARDDEVNIAAWMHGDVIRDERAFDDMIEDDLECYDKVMEGIAANQ